MVRLCDVSDLLNVMRGFLNLIENVCWSESRANLIFMFVKDLARMHRFNQGKFNFVFFLVL